MKIVLVNLRLLIVMTFLLGGVYPLMITLLGKTFFPIRSQGSLIKAHHQYIGSELIAQKFTSEKYFWPRPSSIDYKSESSGATQRSGTHQGLKEDYLKRQQVLGPGAPADMLYSSGSGLDPHISLDAVEFQKARVMRARNFSEKDLNKLILQASEDRFLGFMGQPRVNVLKLNRLLDK